MVKFDKNCIIFTNSKKNKNEISDILIQNYALKYEHDENKSSSEEDSQERSES